MIDAGIYGQIQAPRRGNMLEQVAQIEQLKGAQSQNRLADLMYGEKEREIGADKALAGLLSRGEDAAKGLATQGFGKQSIAYTKAQQEAAKQRGDIDKQKTELIDARLKQSRSFLENVTTPEQYIAWHEGNHKDDVLGPALAARGVTAEKARASITAALSTPGGLEKLLKQSALGIEKFTEMNKPTITTRNLGATTDTIMTEGMTGKTTVANSARNSQSPDSVASTASAAASRAQSASQFAVTSGQKERELGSGGKPPAGYRWKADGELEAIPGGPAGKAAVATEGERKAATLLKRMEGSQAQLETALKEKPSAAKPGVVASGMRAVGAEALANTTAVGSERQRVEAAQLDMLDAALTLGTGAAYTREQLEGYRKSYFPQLGDTTDNVKDKKARLKNVIDAAKIAAGRAGPQTGGATGDFSKPAPNIDSLLDKYK